MYIYVCEAGTLHYKSPDVLRLILVLLLVQEAYSQMLPILCLLIVFNLQDSVKL